MKYIAALAIIFTSASCSTVKTLNPEHGHVDIQHQGSNSYCGSIPRVYSGVAYNVCKANGEPNPDGNLGGAINGIPLVFIDTVCSAAADTVALPYTIIRQVNEGNIEVN